RQSKPELRSKLSVGVAYSYRCRNWPNVGIKIRDSLRRLLQWFVGIKIRDSLRRLLQWFVGIKMRDSLRRLLQSLALGGSEGEKKEASAGRMPLWRDLFQVWTGLAADPIEVGRAQRRVPA